MANAPRDNNYVPVFLGTSNDDGSTPLVVKADPSTHVMTTDDGTTGTDKSGDNATRDSNYETVLMVLSETDGVTPVALYIDSVSGGLLTDST